MVPSQPEYEITSPKGNNLVFFPGDTFTIWIAAVPGIEEYLNSLEVYFALGDADMTPKEINFTYVPEYGEYKLNTLPAPSNKRSGTGMCKVGEKQKTFPYKIQ